MASSARGPGLPPFDAEEHADRLARVRRRMAEREIDVLYVTSPPNLAWLCGYEASWYPPRLPLGLVVERSAPTTVLFDWTRHEEYARRTARADELVLFDYGDAVDVVVTAARGRGWTDGTVGLEPAGLNPSAAVMTALTDGLAAAGATVVDGDWLVDGARAVKSPAEVERLRAAGAMVDAAFVELQRRLRPGLTELQVSALLTTLLADAGSEIAAQPVLVSSGPTAWLDIHAFPSRRVLEEGDLVSVDGCGVVDRYHANLARTFAIGDADPRAGAMLDAAAGALDELRRVARPSEHPDAAMAAADAWVRDRLPPEQVWWVGGYALGVCLPPSWVGHAYLAGDGPERILLDPGYASNFETVLVHPDAGFEVCCIDTVVMTENGLEALSAVPRALLPAGGG
ncbi:MAG: M24 family metallopeptidase [Solirubrobacteraceae bacterium]